MESIQKAIRRAIAENRMHVQTPTDADAANHVWEAVHASMKAQGMILMDKPVTVNMLFTTIEKSCEFEQSLAEIAQELNEALGDFDYATSQADATKALRGIVEAARQAVKMVENAHTNWPLHKPIVMTDYDREWEANLLRGTIPGAADAVGACQCSSCSGAHPG
jgi:hypothetical protein